MLSWGENSTVSLPEIGVADTLLMTRRDSLPEQLTSSFTPTTHHTGYDLPRPFTKGQPDPTSVMLATYKRPQLVEFKLDRFRPVGFDQRVW